MTAKAMATAAAGAATLLAGSVASADAATVTVDKPCYGGLTQAIVTGAGFTPGDRVGVRVDGGEVTKMPFYKRNPVGNPVVGLDGLVRVPLAIPQPAKKQASARVTVYSLSNPLVTASVGTLRSQFLVSVSGNHSKANRPRTIRVRGFTAGGRTVYVHLSGKGTRSKTYKLGRLKGACGTLKVRRRLFRGLPKGRYRLSFDTQRKRAGKPQRFTGTVRVY